jgi:hypothetical protein
MALKILKMQPPSIELRSTGKWGTLPQVSAAGPGFAYVYNHKQKYILSVCSFINYQGYPNNFIFFGGGRGHHQQPLVPPLLTLSLDIILIHLLPFVFVVSYFNGSGSSNGVFWWIQILPYYLYYFDTLVSCIFFKKCARDDKIYWKNMLFISLNGNYHMWLI